MRLQRSGAHPLSPISPPTAVEKALQESHEPTFVRSGVATLGNAPELSRVPEDLHDAHTIYWFDARADRPDALWAVAALQQGCRRIGIDGQQSRQANYVE